MSPVLRNWRHCYLQVATEVDYWQQDEYAIATLELSGVKKEQYLFPDFVKIFSSSPIITMGLVAVARVLELYVGGCNELSVELAGGAVGTLSVSGSG